MQRLFDLPYEHGGVTFGDDTTYQVIALPVELKIWLESSHSDDWVALDLEDFDSLSLSAGGRIRR